MLRGSVRGIILRVELALVMLSAALVELSMLAAPLLPSEGVILLWGTRYDITRFDLMDVHMQMQRHLVDIRGFSNSIDVSNNLIAYFSEDEHLQIMNLVSGAVHDIVLPARPYVSPVWSPDGSQVALAISHFERGVTTLYVSDDWSTLREVFTFPEDGPYGGPTWSPDGRWISQPTADGFYVVNVESGEAQFFDDLSYTSPRWSPDGQQLAFISSIEAHDLIHVLNLTMSNVVSFGNDARWRTLEWMPDGEHLLASTGSSQLYILDITAQDMRLSSTDEAERRYHLVGVSPAANDFAVYSYISGSGSGLYVYSLDSAGQIRLHVPVTNYLTPPEWSDDGQQIAFASQEPDGTKLFVVHADGSTVREIPVAGFAFSLDLEWLP
ncbi:MAG: PD40 domain-containing protein [Burkholderiales bacterium]|nr:PD40 domain-containing protein [Anaerolineae bacterium]